MGQMPLKMRIMWYGDYSRFLEACRKGGKRAAQKRAEEAAVAEAIANQRRLRHEAEMEAKIREANEDVLHPDGYDPNVGPPEELAFEQTQQHKKPEQLKLPLGT